MQYDLAVIGAGVSGLSLAHFAAKKGLCTVVIEKNRKPGGCINTVFNSGGDDWLELGAHTCYNSYGNLLSIVKDLKIEEQIIKKIRLPFKYFTQGKISSILSAMNFSEALVHIPNVFFQDRNRSSVRDYYTKVLGTKNYEALLGPALSAVVCQDAGRFPASLIFKKRPRDHTYPRSFSFKYGLQTFITSLVNEGKFSLITEGNVINITKGGKYFIKTDDGQELSALKIALAVPPSQASVLLEKLWPEAAAIVGEIDVVTVKSLGIITEAKNLKLEKCGGLIGAGESFYSVVSRDPVKADQPTDKRGFTFHFKPEAAVQLPQVKAVLGLRNEANFEEFEESTCLPSLSSDHLKTKTRLEELLHSSEKSGKILISGNYFSGLAIEDCISLSLSEIERITVS